jgi:hypothetical protein
MKRHAVLFVQRTNKIAHLRPEHPIHRPRLRRYYMNFDAASTQSRCDFQSYKTRPDQPKERGIINWPVQASGGDVLRLVVRIPKRRIFQVVCGCGTTTWSVDLPHTRLWSDSIAHPKAGSV